MSILNKISHLLLQEAEIKPVPKNELDDFLSHNNIMICDEYYQFLLKYGNSDFLNQGFFDVQFMEFQRYYLDEDTFLGKNLPQDCTYIGSDFITEPICIDNKTKQIYGFDDNEKDVLYYYGLSEFLFFCLMNYIDYNYYFECCQFNIKIDDVELFKRTYLDHEIKNIYIYKRYFIKDNMLIVCDDEFGYYHIYQGGILNQIIDDR